MVIYKKITDKQVMAFLRRQFPKMKKRLSKKTRDAMIRAYYRTEAELNKYRRAR